MRHRLLLSLLLLPLAVGCAASVDPHWTAWAARQGGIDQDAVLQQRLTHIAAGFAPLLCGQPPRAHVLHSPELAAYSWPDGSIFITRGLMERATDDEVAAAMAHELGHLLDNGHLHPGMAIKGCAMPPDAECRADLLACQLLEGQHLHADALIDVLHVVQQDPSLPSPCRQVMDLRLRMLQQRISSRSAGGSGRTE